MSVPGGFRQRSTTGGIPQWVLLLLLCAVLAPVSRASLIWENSVGSALNPGSFVPDASNGLQTVSLGAPFAFPFEGASYTSMIVATSGLVWLGNSNGSQCCTLGNAGATMTLFEQGGARIAPGWADLRPDLGGSVDFNQISDGSGTRSVLTFLNVPTDPANPSNPATQVTFQMQLFTTGEIVFSYKQFGTTSLGPNPATVIGLTGGGDFSPDIVDFTQLPIFTTATSLYDYQALTGNFNLSGDSIIFIPNITGDGWEVTSAAPEPATLLVVAGTLMLFSLIRFLIGTRTNPGTRPARLTDAQTRVSGGNPAF